MGQITITTELQPRGPAAAIVLDEDRVARDRRVAQAPEMLHEGRPRG